MSDAKPKCDQCGLTLKEAEVSDGFCAKCYKEYNARTDAEEARAQGAGA
jgi:protein-arginine kinase activator protein McsA